MFRSCIIKKVKNGVCPQDRFLRFSPDHPTHPVRSGNGVDVDKNEAFTSNAAAVSLTRRFPIITLHRLERYLKLKKLNPKTWLQSVWMAFFFFFFYSEAVFELTFGGFLCLLPLLRRHVPLYFMNLLFFRLSLWLFILVGTRITGMAGILEVLEGRGRREHNRST